MTGKGVRNIQTDLHAMEDPPLASLSLTHVRYNPNDPLSYASAWLALVPQGLCVTYVSLIWASREIEILLMFAGQMACEALNFVLKRLIREERPTQMHGKGYGMPSSHSQFVAFFSVSLSLWLLFRHVPTTGEDYSPSTYAERLLLSVLACMGAAAVGASRVYLNYHTPKQVLIGMAAGASFAVIWFLFTTSLRRYGWIKWGLDTWISRKFRFRDLITTEDMQDGGWVRWESRRRAKRRIDVNGMSKKAI
ncbi:dolichyldiphosphatase [Exophiala viscosa]|uniref:Dolichyldiphosphatase n=1 Tax=Exophiala viscosa TaxID=2486360 RepID=A0AAN6E042_9EURO|nr:dolichyldiphosphatase [Exophiala viscosa]